uniref:ABC2_membrane domain-containing protein n=1 Tax=Caenorhabditis tropicalis TaxID=1561998 RepID=A0A1I7UN52_9PELO
MDDYARYQGVLSSQPTVYLREVINRTVGQPIENISYIGTKFYNTDKNGTMTFNAIAWIGVCQMWFMVRMNQGRISKEVNGQEQILLKGSSVGCVFGFGFLCYIRLSDTLSIVSSAANNLQKQLFYSLVMQTLIPMVLMHFPITIFFLCPMFNLDTDFATAFILITITLYPAIDPLPSFFIIKNYREATMEAIRVVLCCKKPISKVGVANSVVSENSGVQQFELTIQDS